MQVATTRETDTRAQPRATTSAAVGGRVDLSSPATTARIIATRHTSHTTWALARNSTRSSPGSEASQRAPVPSRQKAFTPKSRPAPAATRPGSITSDGHSRPASAETAPGRMPSTSSPRRSDDERQTLARSIARCARSADGDCPRRRTDRVSAVHRAGVGWRRLQVQDRRPSR